MVAGACLVAAFQSRNSFTSGMKSRLAATRCHMRPRSGARASTILGGFTIPAPTLFFKKNARSYRFFTGGSALQRIWKQRQKGRQSKDVLSVVSLPLFSLDKKIASEGSGHKLASHLEFWDWSF